MKVQSETSRENERRGEGSHLDATAQTSQPGMQKKEETKTHPQISNSHVKVALREKLKPVLRVCLASQQSKSKSEK